MKRRSGYRHPKRSLEDIRASLNCSIEEAARLMGYTRRRITALVEEREFQTFPEGKRIRIVTSSIVEYQNRKVAEARGDAA